MNYNDNDITLIITTFIRYFCVENLLKSIINSKYNNIHIMIVDDSEYDYKSKFTKYKNNFKSLEYYKLEHDKGLSYKRNFGINNLKTEYFIIVDDDTKFINDKSDIFKLKEIYDNSDYDILACRYGNYANCFNMFIKNDTIIKNEVEDSYKLIHVKADFIQNFFISKKSIFKEKNIKWRDELKVGEHIAFCYDLLFRDDVKLGFTKEIFVDNDKKFNDKKFKKEIDKYKTFRFRGKYFHDNYFFTDKGNNHGIRKIKNIRIKDK